MEPERHACHAGFCSGSMRYDDRLLQVRVASQEVSWLGQYKNFLAILLISAQRLSHF